jgi:peptidoglycan/LPS O-acetylase OafA/YrhL
MALWPWSLTPLTAQILGAVSCLGLAGIGALIDRRWSSTRLPFKVAGVMLTAILVAGVRANAELIPATCSPGCSRLASSR